jgi:diguanylate cyclase (GGDEF)-like protein
MTTDSTRQQQRIVGFVGFVAVAATLLFSQLLRIDLYWGYDHVNWLAFGLLSVLLFISETRPSMWMRVGDGGEVTPGWAFAYALLLLGSPAAAVGVMVLTNCYVDLKHHKGALKIIFNAAQIAAALSAGGLILHGFGVHGGITSDGHIPIAGGLGIVLGGMAVFIFNGLLTATVIGLHQGVGFLRTMRAGFALSMTADGALLALAPVFVIAIEYSIVMLPLLGVTTFLVYHSAKNALRSEHEATHDPLTHLLNRRAFDQYITSSLGTLTEAEEGVAVLVMDLDRFKDINDRLGHQIGDRLLVSFAEQLERVLPPMSRACRLGGDEFAALVPSIRSEGQLRAVVARLHEQLSEQHNLDGFPLTVAVSMGVSIAPDHGLTGEQLIAAADVAMYRAKRFDSGVEFGCRVTEAQDHGRVGLLHDLSDAIANHEIHAHYQPQIDLTTGDVTGVEALMRWTHPTYGPISPSDFIGVAEQTDLIGPITEVMFRTAMTDLLTLGDAMPSLAVNVAPRSLLDRQFASRILGVVEELGFPPELLEIEITERAIVTGSERTTLTLGQFRDAGISISIDDFGTGYSSFRILRELRADRLKVDRQFTSQIMNSDSDELIVVKVIELAHGLGLDVVAEGVESTEVWNRLCALDCDIVQGYAIARPMPIDSLTRWLHEHRSVDQTIEMEREIDRMVIAS